MCSYCIIHVICGHKEFVLNTRFTRADTVIIVGGGCNSGSHSCGDRELTMQLQTLSVGTLPHIVLHHCHVAIVYQEVMLCAKFISMCMLNAQSLHVCFRFPVVH